MGHLRRGGIYGVRDVATALGVEPRELALMSRSGQIPGAAWAEALDAEKKPKKRTEHAALEVLCHLTPTYIPARCVVRRLAAGSAYVPISASCLGR